MPYDIQISYTRRRIDERAYYLKLAENMQELTREAALRFAIAALSRVPVWSGQSAASFIPFLNKLGESYSVIPVAIRKKRLYSKVSEGKRRSRSALPRANAKFKFGFRFGNRVGVTTAGTEVPYFYLNDTQNMNKTMRGRLRNPTPWGAIKYGNEASRRYIQQNYRRYIPNLRQFVRSSQITFRGPI